MVVVVQMLRLEVLQQALALIVKNSPSQGFIFVWSFLAVAILKITSKEEDRKGSI